MYVIVVYVNNVSIEDRIWQEPTIDFECIQQPRVGTIIETFVENVLKHISSPTAHDDTVHVLQGAPPNKPHRTVIL